MNSLIRKIMVILAVVGIITASFFIGQYRGKKKAYEDIKPQVDTIYHTDTITLSKPIYITKRVVDSIKVPVVIPEHHTDTLFINLPREEKVYEDSTYRAVVSGYKPSLDTISVYQKTITINNTLVVPKKTHWGIGVQAGVGVGKGGVSPYIGVGLSYNLLSW